MSTIEYTFLHKQRVHKQIALGSLIIKQILELNQIAISNKIQTKKNNFCSMVGQEAVVPTVTLLSQIYLAFLGFQNFSALKTNTKR